MRRPLTARLARNRMFVVGTGTIAAFVLTAGLVAGAFGSLTEV